MKQPELALDFADPSSDALNLAQQAFYLEDGHSVCLACPGSGKTRTLIAKTVRLAEMYGPDQVMAITFTRAAAEQMKLRLQHCLGAQGKQIKVFTFHGLAHHQLKRTQAIKIVSDTEMHGILVRAIERNGSSLGVFKAGEAIARFKRQLAPVEVSEEDENYEAYRVYLTVQESMSAHGVIDMDDMMLKYLLAIQSNRLKPLAVKALLVDEFQDVDEIQLNVVLEYAQQLTRIHIVADDDQSIYAFRAGMGYQGLVAARAALNAKQFILDTNYRCAPAIPRCALV